MDKKEDLHEFLRNTMVFTRRPPNARELALLEKGIAFRDQRAISLAEFESIRRGLDHFVEKTWEFAFSKVYKLPIWRDHYWNIGLVSGCHTFDKFVIKHRKSGIKINLDWEFVQENPEFLEFWKYVETVFEEIQPITKIVSDLRKLKTSTRVKND